MNTNEHSVTRTERRIDRKVRMGQIAACLCAFFAALGIGFGMYEANPNGGWVTPVFAGTVAATTLALFWHVVIGAVSRMVRRTTIIALFTAATLVTVIALGASAQAIATAIAGRSALSAELALKIDNYGKTLNDAFLNATRWRGAADSANVIGTGLEAQAKTEEGGGNGTPKGCGPRCSSLRDASKAFFAGAKAMQELLIEAEKHRDAGDVALANLRLAAASSDQMAFMTAAQGVAKAITKLNAIDPKPIIDTTGAVKATEKGFDLTKETEKFRADAAAALQGRKDVAAPVFIPLSLGEATRKQILGSAAHGWIIAGAIDVLPLIFMIAIFVLSLEVGMHQQIVRVKPTRIGKNETDAEHLADIASKANPNGKADKSDNVVKMSTEADRRHPAE